MAIKEHRLKKTIRHSAALLLMALFMTYYGSITLFMHSHVVNGSVISHSHPFAPVHRGLPVSHQHSAGGMMVIKTLSGFFSLAAALSVLLPVAKISCIGSHLQNNSYGIKESVLSLSYGLRAPPLAS